VGKGFGHEIVIGMDYADNTLAPSSDQVTLLANSVLFGNSAAVRVLSYDEFADAAMVAKIQMWLAAAAATNRRTVAFTKAGPWTSVPPQLAVANYQIFLIYDQSRAEVGEMETAGTFLNHAMEAFAQGGGVIVALDGGTTGRMRDLLTHGGLLQVLEESNVAGTQLKLEAPTDFIALNLHDVFLAKANTIAFTTSQAADNQHVFVVDDMTATLPVVVHSVRVP